MFFPQMHAASYTVGIFGPNDDGPSNYATIIDFMKQEENLYDEYKHFLSITENKKLNDTQKLSKERVFTAYFQGLAKSNQDAKNAALGRSLEFVGGQAYPIGRLLLAGYAYAGAGMGLEFFEGEITTAVEVVLFKNDTSLLKILLDHSVNPSAIYSFGPMFHLVQSKEAAQLMVEAGANFNVLDSSDQSLAHKLSGEHCFTDYSDQKKELLCYCLENFKSDESNTFGSELIENCLKSGLINGYAVERVKILLDHGCRYTKETKEALYKKAEQESIELREEMEQVFENHENRGKGIKPAK